MADPESLCQFMYRHDGGVTASIFKATNVLLAKARDFAELLLRQAPFKPNTLNVLSHEPAHIHAQKGKDYTI